MTKRPPVIYKYESFNVRALMNLKASAIYFGSPSKFNDPYDCAITASIADPSDGQIKELKSHYLSKTDLPEQARRELEFLDHDKLKQVIVDAAEKELTNHRQFFLTEKGVTCFSERNDDLLMWAHYGGQYKGFCLEFDTRDEPFTKLRQVKYKDSLPQIDATDIILNPESVEIMDLFCTKSSSWSYEKEWRALHRNAGTLFGYRADALLGIYLGPDIDRLALDIICLITQGHSPQTKFYRGVRSSTQFKVEFEEFTYTSYSEAKRNGLI